MTGSSALDDVQTLRQEAAASEADENRAPPTGTQPDQQKERRLL